MEVRKAGIEDINILIKLRLDFLSTFFGTLSPDDEASIRLQLPSYFKKHINQEFLAILVEVDNKIASTAFLSISEKPASPSFITGKTGTLLNVLTYPEYKRMGFATKAVIKIIEEAKNLGVSSIDLSASADGERLYEKLGFTKQECPEMRLRL
ncbi:GNAT family N-acetyltransferase [Dehalobacter sp. DCM]|uniref:GNAT family N-acetyltransferase n=1 Tax=Dehalobacter sp. DCM TaxID=2907827 RepID=UPI003081C588|nr:GNAT family N-acetyltransferase [Dehalobacter sp. DCM]